MKRNVQIMALVAVLATILLVPFAIPEAEAQPELDIKFEGSFITEKTPSIEAGQNAEITIFLRNNSGVDWESVTLFARGGTNVEYDKAVLYDSEIPSGKEIHLGNVIHGSDATIVRMIFTTDKYTKAGSDSIKIVMSYSEAAVPQPEYEQSIPFTITSGLSVGGSFNKVMGIIPNTLPEPLNQPLVSAAITLVMWLFISLAFVGIIHLLTYIPMKRSALIKKTNLRDAYKFILLVGLIYGIYESLRVYGASEYIIDMAGTVTAILYVILGALIAWEIYETVIQYLFTRKGLDISTGEVDETLIPLFNMLGKIGISTIAVAGIFSALGADLMGIIAGAGIAGLALSLGAQSMLRQFFSGITLLTTRPFKEGDLVKIDGSGDLQVHKVGIMTTWFNNPWNAEIIAMPNDKVSASNITNLTRDNLFYRFNLFLEISRDADIDLAKKILVDAAMDQPQIITDGSMMMPFARVTDVTDSGLKIRLAAYVYVYEEYWGAEAVIRERAIREFKENGIRMAYKRLEVRTEPRGTEDYDL